MGSPDGRPPCIYVAEDNHILLEGLKRALTANGYTVRTARDGAEMLERLREPDAAPDLLLLDVMMPGLDGLGLLRRLRSDPRWAALPVILITAASEDAIEGTAGAGGSLDLLPKPFRLDELLDRVARHARRHLPEGALPASAPDEP